MKHDFKKWFQGQFGKMPMANNKLIELKSEIESLEVRLSTLKRIYKNDQTQRSRWDAALKAWLAKDLEPKKPLKLIKK